ncbi:MAG: Fic family protein [Bdellovibrionales bacterium]|nr:Fic family protein [Bdellovibrionales bacterium]
MGHYIWQRKGWPNFTFDSNQLINLLAQARQAQGQVIGKADFMGIEQQSSVLVEEAFTTSAIEGEKLNKTDIRSSVARRLGLSTAGMALPPRHIDGLVEALLDATTNYNKELNQTRLFSWHAGLFPTGYSGIHKIKVGKWRDHKEPMQMISGQAGKEKVHYQAPPSAEVGKEMKAFFKWWKSSQGKVDGILRAGIAHFWFVSIHPFDDGNGRLARTITDMALAQDEQTGRRLYSLSSQILQNRKQYYDILEKSQKGDCDITAWLVWYLDLFKRALHASQSSIDLAVQVAKFWQDHSQLELNGRQLKVVKKLLEAGPHGFEGGLTNRKYVSMTKVSRETAKRDLADLEQKGFLKRRPGKGRAVAYDLFSYW